MIRIVRMSFETEHVEDFQRLFAERKEKIRNFPGCTYLELWQDHHDPTVFYTYSLWSDAQDLESYRLSGLFGDTWQTVKAWFREKPMAFSTNPIDRLP